MFRNFGVCYIPQNLQKNEVHIKCQISALLNVAIFYHRTCTFENRLFSADFSVCVTMHVTGTS